MNMLKRFLIMTGAVAVAGSTLAAHIVVPTEFREVVNDSGLIVRGVVTDVRGVAAPGGGIDSVATVAVEAALKGEVDRFVSVRVPGGQLGRYRQMFVGVPQLRVGQRAVFFLHRGTDDFWRPVGLTMGIYALRADANTGRAVVNPPLLAGTTASLGRVLRGDIRRTTLPVQEFESIVRLVVAGAALPPAPPAPPRNRGGG
jgi:hypothetical protein